ncbi:hypothetical protein MPER_00961 [Moniliophthora perniciosa FA553]|nr:hypothetical protein MPER_00961 [Moniliophthora perniciosa FA553]
MADILPEDIWKLKDPIATQETTIVDAMSHRTGLPPHDLMYNRTDTTESILQKTRYLKPSASFRSTYQYNNVMYMVLSYLPTRLLREKPPITRYVKEHIFEPLGAKFHHGRHHMSKRFWEVKRQGGSHGPNKEKECIV